MANKNDISVIYNKIKSNIYVHDDELLIEKIINFIDNNKNLNYNNYEYKCIYNFEYCGYNGANITIDKIIIN